MGDEHLSRKLASSFLHGAKAHSQELSGRIFAVIPRFIPNEYSYIVNQNSMQILSAWLAGRIPDVFEGGYDIWRVVLLAPSLFRLPAGPHLQPPKRAWNRLRVDSGDKADMLNDLSSRLLILSGIQPFP